MSDTPRDPGPPPPSDDERALAEWTISKMSFDSHHDEAEREFMVHRAHLLSPPELPRRVRAHLLLRQHGLDDLLAKPKGSGRRRDSVPGNLELIVEELECIRKLWQAHGVTVRDPNTRAAEIAVELYERGSAQKLTDSERDQLIAAAIGRKEKPSGRQTPAKRRARYHEKKQTK